jgi:hypothetical protein
MRGNPRTSTDIRRLLFLIKLKNRTRDGMFNVQGIKVKGLLLTNRKNHRFQGLQRSSAGQRGGDDKRKEQ